MTDPERRRQHDAELASPRPPRKTGVDEEQLLKVYLQRGVRAYKEKRYAEAADNFDRATRAAPDHAQAWYSLALSCSREPRFAGRARDAIARACELAPMNEGYLRAAGRIFARAGDLDRAEAYYNQALEWSANDPAIRRELDELRSARKGRGFSLFGKS